MPQPGEPSRVLHLSTWQVPCGIATYCANLVAALDRVGIVSDVFPLHPHAWQDYLPSDVARLRREIVERARSADVVHVQHEHGLFGVSRGMRSATRDYGRILGDLLDAGKPVVTTFHTAPPDKGRRHGIAGVFERVKHLNRSRTWRSRVAKPVARSAGRSLAIVHSLATRHAFVRSGLPEESVRVVPHGCLPQRRTTISRTDAKLALGIDPAEKLLTIFGFVGRYKGHDVALAALERLPSDYLLAICGGPHPEARDDYFDGILATVSELGLQDRVKITGWLSPEQADLYYAATDVCLAPYRDESGLSASGAITWALGSDRPIVASKIDAFQAIQREANCMLMTTPGQPQEVAWAVERLVGDPSMVDRLVKAAAVFRDRHSWDRVAAETVGLYREVLDRNATARRSWFGFRRGVRQPTPVPLSESIRLSQSLDGWCPAEKAEALGALVLEAKPECVVEIGVYGGRSLVPMALAARTYGGRVHGIDPWSHAAALEGDVGAENAEWWGKLDLEAIYRGFLAGVRRFGVEDTVRVHRMTDTAALPLFADGSIGLLHVDGNHSAEVSMRYVEQWGPKVAPGGYLVMDDIDWVTQAETVAFIERTYAPVRRESSWAIYRKQSLPAGVPVRRAA